MTETATYLKFKDAKQDNFPAFLIVHHTGGDNGLDTSNQTAKIVEDYHLSLGWEGIGYHYYVAKDGSVAKGRPETYHGAHVKEADMNRKSVGICLAGNFDVTMPTSAQVEALRGLLVDVGARYGITPDRILPHRHYALNPDGTPYKSCYGSRLGETWARDLVTSATPKQKTSKEEIISQITDLLKLL